MIGRPIVLTPLTGSRSAYGHPGSSGVVPPGRTACFPGDLRVISSAPGVGQDEPAQHGAVVALPPDPLRPRSRRSPGSRRHSPTNRRRSRQGRAPRAPMAVTFDRRTRGATTAGVYGQLDDTDLFRLTARSGTEARRGYSRRIRRHLLGPSRAARRLRSGRGSRSRARAGRTHSRPGCWRSPGRRAPPCSPSAERGRR